ncbi:MAG: single-stranded-DNA-specific exonuclease RecJ, partial [Deltaproteobacteria bacterium]
MGTKFTHWHARTETHPQSFEAVKSLLLSNRSFAPVDKLQYGDHGLEKTLDCITEALKGNKRIALYADYDVDGTMSCVSWIWFFRAIGYDNFIHYIPCRFKEGYGVNLNAVKHLIDDEKAQVIITMDTGITANDEAKYCSEREVDFICTDHHKIQPNKIPNGIVLNPKLHPDPLYQELCGCGITFVLLRRLAERFPVPSNLWTDLLALAGMATICDVVPLNSVNHKLARLGVEALLKSQRPILKKLRESAEISSSLDEKDVGFRLGPRINAVGRLGHADQVVAAFLSEEPTLLIRHMEQSNLERKEIQNKIVAEAREKAKTYSGDPVLFLGGNWHPGVVGIAASKLSEEFWKPTWLFQIKEDSAKGSARSIPGFDVTEAMSSVGHLFTKFGGHRAAGGFSFSASNETEIRKQLNLYAENVRLKSPNLWESGVFYDCPLPKELVDLPLAEIMDDMKPFGHGFEEPKFLIEGEIIDCQFYKNRHTAVTVKTETHKAQKLMFFNEVHEVLNEASRARFIVTASKNFFQGRT